ncbi:protein Wiz-like isoform X1 [Poeciliopsis prolifica]|uniref:protein Wiz-like isoform X1 n=1 Tax=Poeciliopsis prolifica TaxID=188132 RepID=UPI0024131981|nr:protein Wiz-like isoform X1 [Poeciliopsis prolifica]
MDSQANSGPVVCEVCGAYFETRRGLSSHARLHLRQLGVTVSENSGAPIELLYQLIQEKDKDLKPDVAPSVSPPLPKKTSQQEPKTPVPPEDAPASSKTATKFVATQGSPAKLKEAGASFFPSSPSSSRPTEGSSSSLSDQKTITKPLWAPLETDAPLTLASETDNEIHVCQLCGCWYETRKGLSSHARAHLRQIGIPDADIQGGPIEYLYQIMKEQDFEPISSLQRDELKSSSPSKSSSSKRPSDFTPLPTSPSSKRPKMPETCTCVLCGEKFENRKGLGSHARSHLKHMGVNDLVGKSSAIEAVQELVSSGVLEPMHLPKMSSTASSSTAPSSAPPSPVVPVPSPAASQSRTSFTPTGLSPSPSTSSHSPQPLLNRAPKAKKGFRLAVDPLLKKPKPEPVEMEISVESQPSSNDSSSVTQKAPASASSSKPPESDLPSPPTVLCDFCGQLFDTRKALSCHVRAHLRQLGLTWSIRTSPIDLLKEVMLRREERKEPVQSGSSAAGKAAWSPPGFKRPPKEKPPPREGASSSAAMPVDYSMKDKTPYGKSAVSNIDATCELCGFDFENRKALASHCRAHLRQLGLYEWKADGATSPIETLSELIRRDPNKVAEITRRYRYGDLYIKKSQRSSSLASTSMNSDASPSSSHNSSLHQPEHKAGRKDHSIRTVRGVHAPQHGVSGDENRHSHSRQPSRTGSIPALLPKPPLTPLVKLVGKIYSLKCRFCDEVFHGPLSVQEKWITHLQKHILSLGYKGKEAPSSPSSPPAPPAPALVHPVSV